MKRNSKVDLKKIFLLLVIILWPSIINARSGCCSFHGGVCGCDTSVGRQVCCDGRYSPTCLCEYKPPKQKSKPKPPNPQPVHRTPVKTYDQKVIEIINSEKSAYYSNPNGFREKLIDDICSRFLLDKIFVATRVYRFLPDVK